ncbi:multicopper oxidase family protein [Cellulomonas sp. KRMCY2]|uniref:multicopper oxidase family protein n=1 Tax=Cellulomonas sp. KRMCY2 TaxID=1304865 RepID=UPI0018CC4412|nr:multicopper oxidase family protein [Cellulomonas sp. KRMCY2]
MTRTRTRTNMASSIVAGGALVLLALVAPAGPADAATVPFDLYAVAGTTSLPAGGQTVTVWGYSTTDTPVAAPGGPTLVVDQGDTVEITLHNQLAESTALLFQGQAMVPDRTGAAPSGTKVYTFTADRPGTYLYEAGLVPNGEHQVAMGLYGALVVRPATAGQAYDAATTAFDDEAVLVLSEIDPALNNAADPASFDMRRYAPRYFLVNGKAYPNTDAIPTAAGRTVLLRYVNAGNQYHSMAVLGAHQTVIALDGNPLTFSSRYVAETFGPGQTADALVTAPATTGDATLPVYDGSLLLHNSTLTGSGGMLTFLAVTGSGGGTDGAGPVATDVAFAAGTLTATLDETTTGGAVVQAAEYYLDSMAGTATAMSAADGAFDSPSEDVTLAVTAPSGNHILYVRGQDALGTWGTVSSVLFGGGDSSGPATTFPTLSPTPTNGSAAVTLHATGDDTATGGSAIAAAEYFVDTVGADGSGTAMTVNTPAPTADLNATIPATTVNALAEGAHTIAMHAQDAAGNWGPTTTIGLTVDKTGPTTGGLSAAPSPNNGTLGYTTATPSVRITATTLSDALGTISAAEAFLDTVGANGTGIRFSAADGTFNSATEAGYATIPLSTVVQLADGGHTIFVHARDAAGNWGPVASVTLVIDKVRPALGALSVTPNPTQGATTATLSATATDAATAITRAEWFTGPDPGIGAATAMTITGTGPYTATSNPIAVAGWAEGTYTLTVRARDAAGNWSPTATTTLTVTAPVHLSTVGNTNPPGAGGTPDDADIYTWNGATYTRQFDATLAGLPGGANIDGYDRIDDTHFYLSFAATTTTVPGLGTVQDEDVVYYNNGTWSTYFDGTAHGLTTANHDLDAISIAGAVNGTGGTLYFSTLGNTNPPGLGGTADDADTYSWNGTTYTRIWDATANALPAAANVDGYVRIDAAHFYLSFAATTTTVPGLGAVQDEDITYYNNGTWSTYFNGTAHGLTTDTLDIDAFDTP